ncbi:MAG: PDZ domain-containing protein, partial [Candidatus Omnitrophica bacterium]|nr:PDZ domain-containing protein [Candidatus Omnitrophota bacterium]
ITNVTQGGIIEEIGLKNNDILTQVNGIRLDNLFSLINIAQKLKTSKTIELEIVRNNVPLMLKYSVR